MKRICVFCGAAKGNSGSYTDLARTVGKHIAQQKMGLVYGGGKVGLMGTLADAALENHGEVIGIIPRALVNAEVAHTKITKLHIVESMHARKKMMYDLSDAFLILPGGMGTLDETFEILTWAQIGIHKKPVYILNEFGFFHSLLGFLRHSHNEGFIKKEHLELLTELHSVDDFLKLKW